MAKSKELSELTDMDVIEALANAREELLNLRFQRVTGQLDNNSRIGAVKKDIARALTELRAREISAAEALQR